MQAFYEIGVELARDRVGAFLADPLFPERAPAFFIFFWRLLHKHHTQ
jgi:hypothetical protein